MKTTYLMLAVTLAMGSCKQGPGPGPGPVPPDSGTGGGSPFDWGTGGSTPVPPGGITCDQMCAHLAELSCPDGKDHPQCLRLCNLTVSDTRFSPTPADAERFLACRFNAQTQAD